MEEWDHRLRMPQTISAISSDRMLGVACAIPRRALLSPGLQKPPSHTSVTSGPLQPPNSEKGESCFLHVQEWDSVAQGQSKTSVSHGRGQRGEAQQAGQWLVLGSSSQRYVRPDLLTQGLPQQSACCPRHFSLSSLSAGEIANCWVVLESSSRAVLFLGCTAIS